MGGGSVRDALAAADPDRGRLFMGARAALAAAVTALVLSQVAARWGLPLSGTVAGAMVAMLATTLVTDTGARAQRITALLVPVPAAMGLVAGTLAAPFKALRLALFLVVIFVAVAVRRFGPRGTALGIIGFNAYFFAVYFRATLADLPWLLGSAAIASGVAFAVRFGVLRDRTEARLRAALDAFRAAARLVLARVEPVLVGRWEDPPETGTLLRRALLGRLSAVPAWRLRSALTRLNETALVIEDLLREAGGDAGDDGTCRTIEGAAELHQRVLEMEVAASRVSLGARTIALTDTLPAAAREALARAVRLVREALRYGPGEAGSLGAEPVLAALRAAQQASAPARERDLAAVQVARMAASLQDLLDAAERLPRSVPVVRAPAKEASDGAVGSKQPVAKGIVSSVPVSSVLVTKMPVSKRPVSNAPVSQTAPSAGAADAPAGLHPATRQAIQAVVAGGLAMAAGFAISPDRWFWAVLAAFIVLTRATTRGEIAVRAWHRTLGTVLGAVLGMLLAEVVQGHPLVELALLFVCVFFAFYSLRASYAWMVAWVTAALAILYSLMGRYSPEVLGVRVEETMAGAGIGVIVAAFVLPSRTGGKTRSALAALLRDLAAYLDRLPDAAGSADLLRRARALDLSLRDLRAAAAPLTRSLVPVAPEAVRLVQGTSTLVFYARQLAAANLFAPPQAGRENDDACSAAALLCEVPARLAEGVRGLARAVEGGRREAVISAAPLLARARADAARCADTGPGAGSRADTALLLAWFLRMDEIVLLLARTLGLAPSPEGGLPISANKPAVATMPDAAPRSRRDASVATLSDAVPRSRRGAP